MMNAVNLLVPNVGMARACSVLRVNRSSVYREDARRRHMTSLSAATLPALRPQPPLALSEAERETG
jgi:hypothetical protein